MTTTDEKIQSLQAEIAALKELYTNCRDELTALETTCPEDDPSIRFHPQPVTGQQLFDFWDLTSAGTRIYLWRVASENGKQGFTPIEEMVQNPLGSGWLARFSNGEEAELVFPDDRIMVRIVCK